MEALAVDHNYVYRRASTFASENDRNRLSLAGTVENGRTPVIFSGAILSPRRTADLLLAVVEVVRTRFHVPPSMLARILAAADPVITCNEDRLRFEGFSTCCGVYARLDLLPSAVACDRFNPGTTNVDFNPPVRMALSRLRDNDRFELAVDSEKVELQSGSDTIVERKVSLPVRWLRGFVEVQAHQSRMQQAFSLTGTEFRRFLRELPATWKGEAWLSRSGSGLRLSKSSSAGAMAIGGIARLRVLESVARHATEVRIYGLDGASGWEVQTPDSRFYLVISPEVWRGFSGEGQVLSALATRTRDQASGIVRAALRWQSKVDVDALAAKAAVDRDSVSRALAECAVSGLVGYDLAEKAYFHRELPFNLELITKLQPRLAAARKLVTDGAVSVERRPGGFEAWVRSRDLEYRVVEENGTARCTCPWFAKHGESRGPCKHLLAVRIAIGDEDVTG